MEYLHKKLSKFLRFEKLVDIFCSDNLKSGENSFAFLSEKTKLFSLENCAKGFAQ
jgi:hypothetical protein